jgi:hypothetical protein
VVVAVVVEKSGGIVRVKVESEMVVVAVVEATERVEEEMVLPSAHPPV